MARFRTVWTSALVINGLVLLGCGFTTSAPADTGLAASTASAAPKGESGFSFSVKVFFSKAGKKFQPLETTGLILTFA